MTNTTTDSSAKHQLNSCIYRGNVFHKRFKPVEHSFVYELDYIYLDLDEIEEVFAQSPFWSNNRRNLVSFFREDFLPSENTLKKEVSKQILETTGSNFKGKVFMLATLRSFGYSMNPIVLFYCFDESNALKHVLVEVHNTPWNQRHVYLLSGPNFQEQTNKAFHVSPFMPMNTSYDWDIGDPNIKLDVSIKVKQDDHRLFNASMTLHRIEINAKNANHLIFSHLRQAFKITIGIYAHALKLWIKKVPFHGHPDKVKT